MALSRTHRQGEEELRRCAVGAAAAMEGRETFTGGEEPGLCGCRARGKKTLSSIAVEVTEPEGIGRCRMAIPADGSAALLHPFITTSVEPGARVITDAGQGYSGVGKLGYAHERRSQRAARARGKTLANCWPLSTGSRPWPSAYCPAPTRAR